MCELTNYSRDRNVATQRRRPTDRGMNQPRLYSDLAYLWPIISPPHEYGEEAGYWRRALQRKLGPGRHQILELGVGGGHNLSHLTRDFQAAAVDLSPQMLQLSMTLNPDVDHHLGDMRTVRLGRTFAAVLVHDAISYMLTEKDLKATLETAKGHLRPGGVLLIAPDWVRESFPGSRVLHWSREQGEVAVTVEEYLHDPDPADTEIESIFSYTIKENGSVRLERDTHTMGLFPKDLWTQLMEEAGFSVEILNLSVNEGGYGGLLFLGVLRGGKPEAQPG